MKLPGRRAACCAWGIRGLWWRETLRLSMRWDAGAVGTADARFAATSVAACSCASAPWTRENPSSQHPALLPLPMQIEVPGRPMVGCRLCPIVQVGHQCFLKACSTATHLAAQRVAAMLPGLQYNTLQLCLHPPSGAYLPPSLLCAACAACFCRCGNCEVAVVQKPVATPGAAKCSHRGPPRLGADGGL